jgi:hypothetical protein
LLRVWTAAFFPRPVEEMGEEEEEEEEEEDGNSAGNT